MATTIDVPLKQLGFTTLTRVKSVIFDCYDNYGGDYLGIRSIEFLDSNFDKVITLTKADGDFIAYGSSYSYYSNPEYAFDTSLSKTGDLQDKNWLAETTSNERLIIVFAIPQDFQKIQINNTHHAGDRTDIGVKNVDIYTSENEVTNTTFGTDTANYNSLGRFVFDEHVSSDTIDNQILNKKIPQQQVLALIAESNIPISFITAKTKSSSYYFCSNIPLNHIHCLLNQIYISPRWETIPFAHLSLGLFTETQHYKYNISSNKIITNSKFPFIHSYSAVPLAPIINMLGINPRHSWKILDPTKVKTIYVLVLTGSADGTTDIEIPISSCQMRRRNGEPTWMSVNVPDYDQYLDMIKARSNGQLVVHKGYRFQDGSRQLTEINRVNLENSRWKKDPNKRNITLSGHLTTTNPAADIVPLEKTSYRNVDAAGLRRYRSKVDLWLRPGDTVQVDEESFEVGYISYTIEPGREAMEVVEVEG